MILTSFSGCTSFRFCYFNNSVKCPCNVIHDSVTQIFTFLIIIIIHTNLKLLHCFLFSVIRLWQVYYQYLILFEFAVLRLKMIEFNPSVTTLKPQTNGPSYSNTVIGTLAIDGWAVTFGTARRALGRAAACPGPSSLYQI